MLGQDTTGMYRNSRCSDVLPETSYRYNLQKISLEDISQATGLNNLFLINQTQLARKETKMVRKFELQGKL